MRQENIILILIITATLLLAGCGSEKAPLDEKKASDFFKFTAIKDPVKVTHNTYSLVMPRDWKEVVHADNIILYLPPKSSVDDPFSEKFGIIVAFMPENNTFSLRELTEMAVEESIKTAQGLEFSGEYYDTRLGQIDALKIKFIIRVQNKDLEATQIRAMNGNVFYAFTQQCLEDECEYTDIFNEMAESFEWRNPE